jgi:mRNA interferase MazF
MMQRGDIYFVNLSSTQGREQAGYRPVLVVSADPINRQPLVVTIVVGTSASRVSRNYPTNVRVTAAESGLLHDTVFLCFQLRSLDPMRFIDQQTGKPRRVGTLPTNRMHEVEQALKLVLQLT